MEGLKTGLRELGFEEGRDVSFDIRFTKGDPERLKSDAQELATSSVDLIFTSNANATQAAKAASATIPIVFTLVGDPVTAGLVRRVAKPGGNVSGVSSLTTELAAKRLEILTVLAPSVRRVWAIHHGDDPPSNAAIWRAEIAAKQLNVELLARPVYTAEQLVQFNQKTIWLSYDEEADVIYVNFKKPKRADDSELLDNDVLVRYEGEEIVGMTITNASKKSRK